MSGRADGGDDLLDDGGGAGDRWHRGQEEQQRREADGRQARAGYARFATAIVLHRADEGSPGSPAEDRRRRRRRVALKRPSRLIERGQDLDFIGRRRGRGPIGHGRTAL
jgi:hypothetical protein